jgi:pyruvate dehydrogenase E2 component (dihydrolipoamide acetyltransferase)
VTSDSPSEQREDIDPSRKITRKAQKMIKDLNLDPARFGNSALVREADVVRELNKEYRPLEQTFTKRLEIAAIEKASGNQFASDVSIKLEVPAIEKRAKSLSGNDFIFSVPELISFYVLKSLSNFPELNGFYSDKAYTYSKIRLGFAINVGLGLKVASIGEMKSPSPKEFCSHVQNLLAKYLRNELSPAELSGSTFTISNMYSMNVDDFTPLINVRQGAVLGISSPQPDKTVRLKLRFDHRLADGQRAAEFLNKLAENVLSD